MTSPFQKAIREKRRALAAGETSPVLASAEPDALQLRLLELEADRKVLKGIAAIEDKIEHKRTVLLPKYRPHAEAFLAQGANYENPLFSDVVLWLFDIGEMDTFMAWCDKAIELGVPTPEFIKRDWQTLCCDNVFDWSSEQLKQGNSAEPYLSQVLERLESRQWRVFEKVSAKIYKLSGQALLMDENGHVNVPMVGSIETLQTALARLTKANELHSKIGVGELINNRIPARIRALTDGTNL